MSTGYAANMVIEVSDKGLEKILGKAVKTDIFDMFSKLDGECLIDKDADDLFAPENYDGPIEGIPAKEDCRKYLSALSTKVNAALDKIYNVIGIHAYIKFHSQDDGDEYDEVSGFYFSLHEDECYVPTDKFKKLYYSDMACRAYFVQLG